MSLNKHGRLAVALAALTTLLVAAPTSAAQTATTAPCPTRAFTTIFGAFADSRLYTLAPDGGFEAGGRGWTLSGGAGVVAGSSTIRLAPGFGTKSLQLAAGASATSPAICVERGYPSFRFVARSAGVAPGTINVEVLHATGKVTAGWPIRTTAVWWPTRSISMIEGLFNVTVGQSTTLRLRFAASGAAVRIDDVYIDPRYRG